MRVTRGLDAVVKAIWAVGVPVGFGRYVPGTVPGMYLRYNTESPTATWRESTRSRWA